MQGRCKTCQFWTRPVDPNGKGLCQFIHDDNAASRAEVAVFPDMKRGQNAEFRTFANFGCVEWEESPASSCRDIDALVDAVIRKLHDAWRLR